MWGAWRGALEGMFAMCAFGVEHVHLLRHHRARSEGFDAGVSLFVCDGRGLGLRWQWLCLSSVLGLIPRSANGGTPD